MRMRKLRNVHDRETIIDWLIKSLQADEMNTGTWPMLSITNRPDYPLNLDTLYILEDRGVLQPAYVIVNQDEAVILWVDASRRKKGYAKFMVDTMGIKYCGAMESSVKFWLAVGFEQLNPSTRNNGEIRMRRLT